MRKATKNNKSDKPSIRELTKNMKMQALEDKKLLRDVNFTSSSLERTREQIKYESQTLSDDRICKRTEENNEYKGLVDGLDVETLSRRIKTDFGNISFMEAVRCTIDSIFDDSAGDKTMRESIHEYIGGLKQIGADSVNGFAMVAGLKSRESKSNGNTNTHHKKGISSLFVMKAPRSPFKSDEMIHEVIIGLEGLNSVRQLCPNFSYVFDAFSSGPAVFDSNKNIKGWANQSKFKVSYAIYELIANATEIGKITDEEELLGLIIQCICALQTANKVCDFWHGDAHDENVLVRPYPTKEHFYLRYYNTVGTPYYVKSKGKIATFIDYGMSHIKTPEGKDIGILDPSGFKESMGIPHDESSVITDAYKLICMIAMTNSDNGNTHITELCAKILKYFYSDNEISLDDMKYIIEHQWDDRFNIRMNLTFEEMKGRSKTVKVEQWSVDELIDHCVNLVNKYSSDNVLIGAKNEPDKIFGIHELEMTEETIVEEILKDSTIEVDAPNAYELKHSTGEFDEKLRSAPDESLSKEFQMSSSLLEYKYNQSFMPLEHVSSEDIHDNLDVYTDSALEVFELINTIIEIDEKLDQLKIADKLNDVFNDILNQMSKQNAKLKANLRKVKRHLTTGERHLRKIIYGFDDKTPTESEEKKGSKNVLYSLWDIYRNIEASRSEI